MHCSHGPNQLKTINKEIKEVWGPAVRGSPVPAGVLHHDVVVLVDAAHRAGGGEGLEHPVRPAPVPVLEGLDDLQVQVDVDQVPDLKTPWVPVAILLAWGPR